MRRFKNVGLDEKVLNVTTSQDWEIDMNDELKEQARELAGIYKLHYLSHPTPKFMCMLAGCRYPQLYDMLHGIFKDMELASVLVDNMPPGSYASGCHPNIIRYQYLRYVGRYGKAPPWELVYQWVLKANELRIGD